MDYRDCDLVESLPGRMSGVPVVRGTRGASPPPCDGTLRNRTQRVGVSAQAEAKSFFGVKYHIILFSPTVQAGMSTST